MRLRVYNTPVLAFLYPAKRSLLLPAHCPFCPGHRHCESQAIEDAILQHWVHRTTGKTASSILSNKDSLAAQKDSLPAVVVAVSLASVGHAHDFMSERLMEIAYC